MRMQNKYSNDDNVFSNFLTNRFKTNINTLKKFFPDIACKFEEYVPSKSIDFFCTKKGIPNVFFSDNKKAYYETEDPIAYCKQQIIKEISTTKIQTDRYDFQEDLYGQIEYKYLNRLVEIDKENHAVSEIQLSQTKTVASCFIIGAGLGYHIAELYERIEICNTILIEPDPDIFFASLHTFDWTNLLEFIFSNNFSFNIILGNPDDLLNKIEKICQKKGEFLLYSRILLIHKYNNDSLNVMRNFMGYRDILFRSGFFDDILFASCHTIQAFKEHRNFVNKNVGLGEFASLPVFIIGSGPSIDNDIKFIQKNQDKAIIIACGTAIDVLYHSGIKPDFYACTERVPEIIQSLKALPDSDFFKEIILLSTNVCHPNTASIFQHEALFNKDNEPILTFLKMNIKGLDWIQDSSLSNPLVGNAGVSGAIFLGFKELYLFGLDCGKTLNQCRNHSHKTTLYNEHGYSDTVEVYKTTEVAEGNLSKQVETNSIFLRSAKNIAELLRRNPKVKCFNCSDGVRIECTVPTKLDSIKELFNKRNILDKTDFRNFINKYKTKSIQQEYCDIIKLFSKEKFKELCKEIILHIEKKQLLNRTDVVQLFTEISSNIYNKRNKNDLFFSDIIEDSLQSMFIMVIHTLYGINNQEIGLSIAKKMILVIRDFLTEAPDLFDKFPDYIMGNHRFFFKNNKVGKDMKNCMAPPFPEQIILLKSNFNDPLKKFRKITN